jgi:hypothetical protein
MGVIQDNIEGKRYNKLTARRWVDTKKHITKSGRVVYHNFWEFECDCGNKKILRKSRVTTSKNPIMSCGCIRGESHWKGHGEISKTQWTSIKKHAKLRSITFNISIEYAWKLYKQQKGKCTLSGKDIVFGGRNAGPWYKTTTASLDRIDSKKGYIKGNVQWVHKNLNIMKWDYSVQEFVQWCRAVANHFPGD